MGGNLKDETIQDWWNSNNCNDANCAADLDNDLDKFTKHSNTDCGGIPITISSSIGYPWSPPGSDIKECAKACQGNESCSRFSWYNNQCYFKRDTAHSPRNNA